MIVVELLGFEYCAYGLRIPLPVTKPRIVMVNNYSAAWRARYLQAGRSGLVRPA